MKTIKLNSVLNAFVNYNVVDPNTFEVLNNDWMPQTVFNDIERLASYGIQVLDDNNHVIVATENPEEEPKKKVKKVKKSAKTEKVEKTEEERKQDNIKALESRIETVEEETEAEETAEPVAEQTEEKEVQKEEEPEVEQQEFDLDSTPDEILNEIAKAAKSKPNTIKLIENYAGQDITEYEYSPSAQSITVELKDGKIFEASNKADLLEDIYLAYSKK